MVTAVAYHSGHAILPRTASISVLHGVGWSEGSFNDQVGYSLTYDKKKFQEKKIKLCSNMNKLVH